MYGLESMDTRFWGPSAWQLLHLIAHAQPKNPPVPLQRAYELFFNNIKSVLPCKFCRASTTEFMETEVPLHPMRHDIAHWLYKLHNRVNQKLREQSKTDTNVRDPGPDPSFAEIKQQYETFLKYTPAERKVVPGADFLFTLAYNYADKPTSDLIEAHFQFWDGLLVLFPYADLRSALQSYVSKHMIYPALQSRSAYMRWVHGLLKKLCRGKVRSYTGMCQHVGYYKSKCESPTYRGKTCRRSKDGTYHKVRDHMKTYRITHSRLLQ